MQSDRNGHWSHLSDLSSKGAPPSVILLLKHLLTYIRDDIDTPPRVCNTTQSINPFPAVDKYIHSSIFTLRASTFTTCTQLLQSLTGTPFLLYYAHAPVNTI